MTRKAVPTATTRRSRAVTRAKVSPSVEGACDEIVELIRNARRQAVRAVNIELIDLYGRIGDQQPESRRGNPCPG